MFLKAPISVEGRRSLAYLSLKIFKDSCVLRLASRLMDKTLPLSNGYYALISSEDYEELSRFKWSSKNTANGVKAVRNATVNGKRVFIYLARAVVKATADQVVEHLNGNTLDCTRDNLRVLEVTGSYQLNSKGRKARSKYIGVEPPRFCKGWVAKVVRPNYTTFTSEVYATEEEAAAAYDKALLFFYGDTATNRASLSFNFPDKRPPLAIPDPF